VYDFESDSGDVNVPNSLPRDYEDRYASLRTGITNFKAVTLMTMECTEKGDLYDLITKVGSFSDKAMLRYLVGQLCSGLDHLHSKAEHCHLDLKLDNILVGNDYKLKICDFGFAKPVSEQITKTYGTYNYMAPEVINKKAGEHYYGVQADIFSLGVIMFVLYVGKPPFSTAKSTDRYYSLLKKRPESYFRVSPSIREFTKKLQIDKIDSDITSLVSVLLSEDLSKRPSSIKEVLKHPFFTDDAQDSSDLTCIEYQSSSDKQSLESKMHSSFVSLVDSAKVDQQA
jgi:serine/threonine protein kinase